MRSRSLWAALAVTVLLAAPAALAETTRSTLALNGFSYVRFDDQKVLTIPDGSSLTFTWGTANPDGSVPFTIEPRGARILPIPMGPEFRELRYTLAAPASGTMTVTPTGHQIEFTARVRATLVSHKGEIGSYEYTVPFTTESATARDLSGTRELNVSGTRLAQAGSVVQIVGVATNKSDAVPAPGTAVYTILSGSFDQLP